MRFLKLHGLGNDFLISLDSSGSEPIGADLVRRVCDRHRGIGADGLIHAVPASAGAVAKMTLYNADGQRAEISGNGLRCLAYALRRCSWTSLSEFSIDTAAGLRLVGLIETVSSETVVMSTEMGEATILQTPEPVLELLPPHLSVSFVNMGNPHLIVEVEDANKVEAAQVGAAIDGLISGGTNVHFVTRVEGGLEMNIYERGVGATQACGSGACAAAVVLGEGTTKVSMVGGDVTVDTSSPVVVLVGSATWIAECEVPRG